MEGIPSIAEARAGTGAQPLQNMNYSGRGKSPVVALPF